LGSPHAAVVNAAEFASVKSDKAPVKRGRKKQPQRKLFK
jgi:hypothetical protein